MKWQEPWNKIKTGGKREREKKNRLPQLCMYSKGKKVKCNVVQA